MSKSNNFINLPAKIVYNSESDKFTKFILPHPLSICYKITKKCNYSCPHCITSSNPNAEYGLTTKKAKEIFRKIKNSGIIRVDITGGEPYIRNDIDEILEYTVNLGLNVVVTTNGSLLSRKNIQTLAKLGILVQISIDGPKEINDRLRYPGSFDISVRAIKMLQKANIPVRINCVIQKRNKHVIKDMVEFTKKIKIKNLYIVLICAQGKAFKKKDIFCLSESEEKSARKEILKYMKSENINIKMLDFKNYSYACTLIDTNGDFISQCWNESECIKTGNVFKKDINDIWINSGAFDHALHLMQYIRHPMLYK